MAKWQHKVKIKHLLTDEEDYESVTQSMAAVADELKKNICFNRFDKSRFYKIPNGDGVIDHQDYANKLLERMYDYADDNMIWIN